MESVEEICDYIALINKSNLVLQGKLSEVKQQYPITYLCRVVLTENRELTFSQLPKELNPKRTILKGLDTTLDFEIQCPLDFKIPDVLTVLTSMGELVHFSEVIPSVNDIFIKTVQQHG